MHNERALDLFWLSDADILESAAIDDWLNVLVPCARILDAELHHKIVGPIFYIVVLEPELSGAEPAIEVSALGLG